MGAGVGRVINSNHKGWPECGPKKCPMFPELLQNHCILLCFESTRAQGTFLGGPGIFKKIAGLWKPLFFFEKKTFLLSLNIEAEMIYAQCLKFGLALGVSILDIISRTSNTSTWAKWSKSNWIIPCTHQFHVTKIITSINPTCTINL